MASGARILDIAEQIDLFNAAIGRTVAWAASAVVVLQFAVVLLRYGFGVGSLADRVVIHSHAMLFMLAAAWTLQAGGHMRVDVFYAGASARTEACICSAKPGMTNRDIPE